MNPKIRCRIPTLAISFLAAAMLLLIVGVAAQSQGPAWAPTSGQPLPVTTPATLALPVGEVPPAWQKLLDVGGKLPQLPEAQGSPLGWGGPGAFGYTYADSDEAWGPSPVFEDISAIGTPVALSDFYRAVELPFAFPFYGTTYTQTYLYRDCSGCYSNPTHLAFLDPYGNYTGFIPWMDYVDRDSGAVYVYSDTLTTPARFIIQYDEVFNYYRGITTTSEVILYQNGDILLRYAEGFSDWLSWYPGWQIPWLWTPWYGPFYYAGAPRSDFTVEFYYPEGAWLWPPGRPGANPAGGQATYSFELRNNT